MLKNHKLTAAIGVAAVIAAAAPAGAYAAGHSATSHTSGARHGRVHVWVTPGKGAVDKILLTGAIGDFGTATSETKSGKVDANGNYVKIALKQGSFTVNAVAFNKKANNTSPHVSSATCTLWVTVSGPVTLSDGTGAYAGISGRIHITTSFALLLPRHHSGPRKGTCNMSARAKPRAEFDGQIIGSGPVTL
jgi:hypothetical protein